MTKRKSKRRERSDPKGRGGAAGIEAGCEARLKTIEERRVEDKDRRIETGMKRSLGEIREEYRRERK